MEPSETLTAAMASWLDIFMRRSMHDFYIYAKLHGLSVTQITALFQLRHKGHSSVSNLGDDLEITNPAASQLLERLVQQKLVARSEDPTDRRLKQIVLTEQGKAILRKGLQIRSKWLEELARQMPPEEQQQVSAALNILIARAQQMEDQPVLER